MSRSVGLSHALENLQAGYPHLAVRRLFQLFVKERPIAFLSNLAQLFLRELRIRANSEIVRSFFMQQAYHGGGAIPATPFSL